MLIRTSIIKLYCYQLLLCSEMKRFQVLKAAVDAVVTKIFLLCLSASVLVLSPEHLGTMICEGTIMSGIVFRGTGTGTGSSFSMQRWAWRRAVVMSCNVGGKKERKWELTSIQYFPAVPSCRIDRRNQQPQPRMRNRQFSK